MHLVLTESNMITSRPFPSPSWQKSDGVVGFTSTTEISAERHAEPRASTVAGGGEAGAGVGVPQGDSVKLRHAAVSGGWQAMAEETSETSLVTDEGEHAGSGLVVLRDS